VERLVELELKLAGAVLVLVPAAADGRSVVAAAREIGPGHAARRIRRWTGIPRRAGERGAPTNDGEDLK
jgi:hypothetical protein